MDWRLIPEERVDGATAMALDEVAAETVASGGPATVRLYRWTPSTVSLGYGNDAEIVDRSYCAENDVTVTRRQTGGGAIYHDGFGDVAYSVVAPAAEFPSDVTESYRELLTPVLSAFEAVGADVGFADGRSEPLWEPLCYLLGLDPAHDLVGPDGRKVAGNAQYRTREAIVQHGSLTFDAVPAAHLAPFVDPPVSAGEFADRVCGVTDIVGSEAIDRSAFVDSLTESLAGWADADRGTWSDAELERAERLRREKYDHDRWVRSRTDPSG
jgi:lipoate-protein ligase A